MKEQALSAPVTEVALAEERTPEKTITQALDHAQAERLRRWQNATDVSLGIGITGVALSILATSFGGPNYESAGWAITKLAGLTMSLIGAIGAGAGLVGQHVDSPRKRHVAPAHA